MRKKIMVAVVLVAVLVLVVGCGRQASQPPVSTPQPGTSESQTQQGGQTQQDVLLMQMAGVQEMEPFPKGMQLAPGPEPLPDGASRIKAITVDALGEWRGTGWLVVPKLTKIAVDTDPSVTAVRLWIAPYQSDFTEEELKGTLAYRDPAGDTATTRRWSVEAATGTDKIKTVVVAGAWAGSTFAGYSETLGITHGVLGSGAK